MERAEKIKAGFIAPVLGAMLLFAAACESASPCCDEERNDLAGMTTARMSINGHAFEVWLALTSQEHALGLMNIPASELAPTSDGAIRGMLFVFSDEAPRSFWMKDTPTALDIAYMRADGVIVTIHTMTPFDTSIYPSVAPAQYALEVLAGTFDGLGIDVGDQAVLP